MKFCLNKEMHMYGQKLKIFVSRSFKVQTFMQTHVCSKVFIHVHLSKRLKQLQLYTYFSKEEKKIFMYYN